MASARPAVNAGGAIAYSVFQQGAGLINTYAAANAPISGCGNLGLDIHADVAGNQHFGGRAHQAEDGSYFIDGLEGYVWDGTYSWNVGYVWPDGYVWLDASAVPVSGDCAPKPTSILGPAAPRSGNGCSTTSTTSRTGR